jgi:hypothetical protein
VELGEGKLSEAGYFRIELRSELISELPGRKLAVDHTR